jgi:putative ABC transport system permease protein
VLARAQGERRATLGLRLAALRLGEGDATDAAKLLAETAMPDAPAALALDRALLMARIEADRRFKLKAEREVDYYRKQTMTAAPIKWLGNFLAVTMSIGAVFAAMNTMYAAVGSRTREIGTLRVLGFRRRSVVLALLLEGGFLALIGGALGCAVAFYWNGYTTATMGFETFSEIVFEFRITPRLVAEGLLFAVMVGLAGTFLPALRAARLPVIAALKSL